ncbi:MAG: lipid-binding SYLF domain-containing protein [Gammaproteobacteria bacterium]
MSIDEAVAQSVRAATVPQSSERRVIMNPFKKRLMTTSCALVMATYGGVALAHDAQAQATDVAPNADHFAPQTEAAKREAARIDRHDPMASREQSETTEAEVREQRPAASDAPMDRDNPGNDPNVRDARIERSDMRALVADAATLVGEMRRDDELARLITNAKGMFIVPNYGRAALLIGGRGGAGLLVLQKNGRWTSPAQYDFGGLSAGLQAGAETGSLVMILNTEAAVDRFMNDNSWSLNAEAGLTVADWSGKAQASTGKDVVLWSDTKGLLGGVTLSVTDINYDREQTAAFYGEGIDRSTVFSKGNHDAKASDLSDALNAAG